ncbi:MAG: hypothetical protein EOP80_02335 [Variovorax sp.]|nr:MAG: hypothetical protein EOP80_02335 [Variovorax sp.]
MNANRLPTLILRYLAALRSAFGQPSRQTRAGSEATAVLSARPPEPLDSATHEDFINAAPEPSLRPRLRTLEEVRADLAQLRERTRARQASAQARRDMSFAPTDFMGFTEAATASSDSPASGFAPTDFLDFGMPALQPGR